MILFQQHKRRLYPWTSPDGQYQNQIDYILCSQRWRSSTQSAKTRLGADCGSDHEFFIAKLWLKLKKVGKTTTPFGYDQNQFSSVQSLGHVQLFVTPWATACQVSLSITNSQSLPKLISIKSVMPSNHVILGHPCLLLPSVFPKIRVISNESAFRIRWPKYRSFSFNISPYSENPGLMCFRMDWLDLLADQGTTKSQKHQFFSVQLSS